MDFSCFCKIPTVLKLGTVFSYSEALRYGGVRGGTVWQSTDRYLSCR